MSYGCGSCGRLFTALSGFDAHQSVDYRRKDPVVCQDPASLGMEQNAYGRWYVPADASSRGRLLAVRGLTASGAYPSDPPGVPRGSEAIV